MTKLNEVKEAPSTPVMRSTAGIRDALFDEIDAIRAGTSNPTRANAVAKLATGIVDSVRVELEVHRYVNSATAKANGAAQMQALSLPQAISLGA